MVIVEVGVVTYPVAVVVVPLAGVQREGVGDVRYRVAIVVAVSVVSDAVIICIDPFSRVEREGVGDIGKPVVVVIAVDGVARAVLIGVRRQGIGVQWVGTAGHFDGVAEAVAIIIDVGIISD